MIPEFQHLPLTYDASFQFECCQCGECCRNVKDSVMLESLDLFRIAKHLNMDTAEVSNMYAKTISLDWGMPILVMKTKQHEDACVFLKSGKCSIHSLNPRACRTYPILVGHTGDSGGYQHFVLSDKHRRHLAGKEYRINDWVDTHLTQEDREYIETEMRVLREIGKILKRLSRSCEERVNFLMLRYRYFLYEIDHDFMRQYNRNMAMLKIDLEKMLGG